MIRTLALAVLLVGCLRYDPAVCGDHLCPESAVCIDGSICATPDQLAACADHAEAASCDFFDVPGTCFHGVCEPMICGDGKVFAPEVCDDRNTASGDGCAGDCQSNETCGNGIGDLGEQCDDGNLRSRDGCTSTCEVESIGWFDVTPTIPPLRVQATATYDARRGRVVLFGGTDGQRFGDTWELVDGERFQSIETAASPSPRIRAAMTFDVAHGVTLLFGGDRRHDTWTYAGTQWIEQHPITVPPSGYASLGYDTDAAAPVLVVVSAGIATTWQWTGTDWHALSGPDGWPLAENGYVAYDSVAHQLVYVLSSSNVAFWHGTRWYEMTITGLPTTYSELSVIQREGRVLLTGGSGGGSGFMAKIGQLDVATLTWAPVGEFSAAHARYGAAGAYDAAHHQLVMIGGLGPDLANARPLVRGDDGTEANIADPPQPPTGIAMVAEPARGRVLGWAFDAPHTWTWDGRWRIATPAHEPPLGYSYLAPTATGDVMLVDGVTWTWDGDDWTQTTAPALPVLQGAAVAYDAAHNRVLWFGGHRSPDPLVGTTRAWDGTSWTAVAETGPSPRQGAAMAYDDVSRRVILFGGYSFDATGSQYHDDTWAWDGAAWTELAPPERPLARANATLVFDQALGHLLLFGGDVGSAPAGDIWTLDGDRWTPLATPPPPRNLGVNSSIAYDAVRAQTVSVFALGAFGGAPFRTFAFRSQLLRHPPDACTDHDTDGDHATGCADPDCAPRCDGCGDGACNAYLEDHALCPEDCP